MTPLQATTSNGEITFESLILIPVSVPATPDVIVTVSPFSVFAPRVLDGPRSELNISTSSTWYVRILVS